MKTCTLKYMIINKHTYLSTNIILCNNSRHLILSLFSLIKSNGMVRTRRDLMVKLPWDLRCNIVIYTPLSIHGDMTRSANSNMGVAKRL